MVIIALALAASPAAAYYKNTIPAVNTRTDCKWLPWGAWADCRGVCGSGVQTRVRRCLGGIAGTCCSGRTLDSKPCSHDIKDDTCSYWSGWGEWSSPSSSCGDAQICKRRTCYGRGTDHCHGPDTICTGYKTAPPTLSKICDCDDLPTCCPVDNPNCCQKPCYSINDCTGQSTLLDPEPCEQTPPCCSEMEPWSAWTAPTQSCGSARVTRTRSDRCLATRTVPQIQEDYINMGCGTFGPWINQGSCKVVTSRVDGKTYECPGSYTKTRSHSCFDNLCSKTSSGLGVVAPAPCNTESLNCHATVTCGPGAPFEWGPWDKTEEQCSKYYLCHGVSKSRQLIDPCTGNVVKTETLPCGGANPAPVCPRDVNGNYEFSQCSNSCGGLQWRYCVDHCKIDPKTGKAEITYFSQPCGQSDGWSAWGQWTDTCATTFPAACYPTQKTRRRFSACGVLDPLTGKATFEQTETANCEVIPRPAITCTAFSAWSIQCKHTADQVATRQRTCTQVCREPNTEIEQKDVPPCCVEQPAPVFGPCGCDSSSSLRGRMCRQITNTCPEKSRIECQECTPSLEPRVGPSEWTVCIAINPLIGQYEPDPTSCGILSRYTCANCETLTPQCFGIQWEKAACPKPADKVTYGACRGSCSLEGLQTVTTRDACTGQVVNTVDIPCQRDVVLVRPQMIVSQCVHPNDNTRCTGYQRYVTPAMLDPETGEQCEKPVEYTKECGGPDPVPQCVWYPQECTASPPSVCMQSCHRVDECTGLVVTTPVVAPRACVPASGRWTPFSQWSICGGVNVKYAIGIDGRQTNEICLGNQDRYQTDMCRVLDHQHDVPKPCGLQVNYYNVAAVVTTGTVQDFCKADGRYHPCKTDVTGSLMWSACSADCDATPPRPTGLRMISRQGKCATDANWHYGNEIWYSEPCQKICEEEVCTDWMWPEWNKCSSNCDIGHQHRQQYRECWIVKFGSNGIKTKQHHTVRREMGEIQTQNCGIKRVEEARYSDCTSLYKCGVVAGQQVYCGAGVMTRSVYAIAHESMLNCPAAERAILIFAEQVPCQLPDCPRWTPFRGSCEATGDQCATTAVQTRTCDTIVGAETCGCPNDGEGTTKTIQCQPLRQWTTWSDYSACDQRCTVGNMQRHRHQFCKNLFPTEIQMENANCDGPEMHTNRLMCIHPTTNQLLDADHQDCWSVCSYPNYGENYAICLQGQQHKHVYNPCLEKPEQARVIPRFCGNPTGGSWTVFGQWTVCAACGGTQQRTRSHTCKVHNGKEDQTEINNCAIVSSVTEWTVVGTCPSCYTAGQAMPATYKKRTWSCNGRGANLSIVEGTIDYNTGVEMVGPIQCVIPPCCSQRWSDWSYGRCTCKNRDFATATRYCINESDSCKCVGESAMQVPCIDERVAVGTSWEVKGVWGPWSVCPAVCSPSGRCDAESGYYRRRKQELYCVDGSVDNNGNTIQYPEFNSDGTIKVIWSAPETCPCTVPEPVQPAIWTVCDSPDPLTCPGQQTGYLKYTCGSQIQPVVPRTCGTPGTWGAWAGYSECTKTCGSGTKYRTRSWTCRQAGIPDQTETVNCNESPCNYYGAWSNWGACSASCGIGKMTRSRYCHGGNDGSGFCVNDGGDPCDNANLDNTNFVVGKVDCARCEMGECCHWDWSGWTSCCNSGNKNIRLRFKAQSCGQEWEYIQKPCETAQVYTGQTYPSCQTLQAQQTGQYSQYGIGASIANPDKITTAILQGPKMGHADDPNLVRTYTFTDTRVRAPYNTPTNVVTGGTTTTTSTSANPPSGVTNAATNASWTYTQNTVVAPYSNVANTGTTSTSTNNPYSWMFGPTYKTNSNTNTPMKTHIFNG